MEINFNDVEPTRGGKDFTGKVFSSDTGVEVVRIKLDPLKTIPSHATEMDVIFYILSGKGTIVKGEEVFSVTDGSILDSPKGIPHAIINQSDLPMELLVIKLM